VAGVKQFDRDKVLDRAMTLFWRRGYEATSIEELVAATRINRGSLYATFGNKRSLFLVILERYWERVGTAMMSALDNPDPRRAIELMLESIVTRTSDPRWPRGCLNTNTALECPGVGDEISRKIAEGLGRQESAIYGVLRRAQAEGSLDPAQDARALARLFLGVAQGMNVVNKATADPTMLKDMVSAVMSVWKVPVRRRGRTTMVGV
jgi:TetR/AcrR family transcriptional regulator, transcriptional repressor for nem operon